MMVASLAASSAALILLVAFRRASAFLGLVDRPDGRKLHKGNIPLVGGIAVVGATLVAAVSTGVSAAEWILVHGMLAHAVIGAVDDRWPQRASTRLGLHVCIEVYTASLLMPFALGIPATIVSAGILAVLAVFVCNALNMLDGMDGLAGSMALLSLVFCMSTQTSDAMLPLLTACALVPFLLMNLGLLGHKVFLGDAGSMALGHVVFWSVANEQSGVESRSVPLAYLWSVALPALDAVAVVAFRLASGMSPLQADRTHIHQLLQRVGMGPRTSLGILFGMGTLLLGMGTFVPVDDMWHQWIAWTTVVVVYCALHGYLRRGVARLSMAPGATRRHREDL